MRKAAVYLWVAIILITCSAPIVVREITAVRQTTAIEQSFWNAFRSENQRLSWIRGGSLRDAALPRAALPARPRPAQR